MKELPENWNEMSHMEKRKFFCRFYVDFGREGEIAGLREWAPEDVKAAFEQWKKDDEHEQA